MRSPHAAPGISILACTLATGLWASTSSVRADDKQPAEQGQATQEQKRSEDEFFYRLQAPQAVRRYDAATGTCIGDTGPGNRFIAKDGLRFVVLKTIKGVCDEDSPCPSQLVVKFPNIDPENDKLVTALFDSAPREQITDRLNAVSQDPEFNRRSITQPERKKQLVQDIYITSRSNGQYFCLEKDAFDTMLADGTIVKSYRDGYTNMVYGLSLVLPFKLRRATAGFNTELTESITIAGVLGPRWRISDTHDYHIDFPLVNAGLTTLEIEQGRAPAAMTGNKRILGLTASAGLVLELSDFQLGLMMGIDRATGDEGRGWVYNDKLWYSFAIGYTFLKNEAK